MANLLRQIIAGPRARHADSNLDLCYVTPFIIATSGPSGTYPQLAYRNPLDKLVSYLDKSHGEDWCIWEFRAEGTGYPDKEVRDKVRHYPFPDHHPPPFAMVPLAMASMRNWLTEGGKTVTTTDGVAEEPSKEGEEATEQAKKDDTKAAEKLDKKPGNGRVVVVHCKAGKGRSGTMACSYLISECGWTKAEALVRFTERRMRSGFGQGVSIPSQLRYVDYVSRWTAGGKKYIERPVEIIEVHTWGLREGVKVAVEIYGEEGKKIETAHIFGKNERLVVEGDTPGGSGRTIALDGTYGNENEPSSTASEPATNNSSPSVDKPTALAPKIGLAAKSAKVSASAAIQRAATGKEPDSDSEAGGQAVIFRPAEPLILPSSDINIDFERRHRARYGMTMVTAVAHPDENGVFEIEWDKMDGIKGSLRKGTRALDRVAVVWRFAGRGAREVVEPGVESEVPEMKAADWKGQGGRGKELGLRTESPATADVSKASSVESEGEEEVDEDVEGVKSSGPGGEEIKVDESGPEKK
ncbi:Telomerase protein component 1 [Pseudogymnoascus australis]